MHGSPKKSQNSFEDEVAIEYAMNLLEDLNHTVTFFTRLRLDPRVHCSFL
jgi:hypothetical protein